jgi:SPP1 gp7 family putative phage head morphogenesis protein
MSLLGAGARAAEEILDTMKIDVRKALDPLDPDDYLVIVENLTNAMEASVAGVTASSMRSALETLDVDWGAMSSARVGAVIAAANSIFARIPEQVIGPIENVLTISGGRTMRNTRRSTRRRLPAKVRAPIGVSLSLVDDVMLEYLVTSQGNFITDEIGRRVEHFSQSARDIVESGASQGLGRKEIAERLEARVGQSFGAGRTRNYWETVAGSFVNNSRTYSSMASYQEAGIERYIFEAVLDEVTTDQCRFLHGQVFSVGSTLGKYRAAAAAEDPTSIKEIMPWMQAGRNDAGERILYVNQAGERVQVAQVTESGVGTLDSRGAYSNAMSSSQLSDIGANNPPCHAACRSTTTADFG